MSVLWPLLSVVIVRLCMTQRVSPLMMSATMATNLKQFAAVVVLYAEHSVCLSVCQTHILYWTFGHYLKTEV